MNSYVGDVADVVALIGLAAAGNGGWRGSWPGLTVCPLLILLIYLLMVSCQFRDSSPRRHQDPLAASDPLALGPSQHSWR